MILLAFDTATPDTVAAVLADARVFEARDEPAPGTRPQHAARLLALAEDALAQAQVGWAELDRIAVGVGPGGFTGLRIGVATGRALAQGHSLPVVAVSSLRALALGALDAAGSAPVLAAIDARRGEVFAAVWAPSGELELAPAAYPPETLVAALEAGPAPPLAVGDGAIRFRAELAAAGAVVPCEGSELHRIGGVALCELGRLGDPVPREHLLPDYLREPDAKPPRPT